MKLTDELLEQHAAEARDLWLSTLPQQEEVPPHKFSRRFERKMRRLRAEQRRSPRMNRIVHILRYVAACAAVVLCIGGTAYAYRIGVIDTIVQVFREYTSITYSSETAAEDAEFPESTLTYIPDGMERSEGERIEENDDYRFTAYTGKNNTKFYLEETTVTSNNRDTQTINTENAVVNHFVIAGEQAMSSAKAKTVIIVWTHQSVSYTLITYYLSYDEALKIAEGIQQN